MEREREIVLRGITLHLGCCPSTGLLRRPELREAYTMRGTSGVVDGVEQVAGTTGDLRVYTHSITELLVISLSREEGSELGKEGEGRNPMSKQKLERYDCKDEASNSKECFYFHLLFSNKS